MTSGNVHREEPAPHGGSDPGELADGRLGDPVLPRPGTGDQKTVVPSSQKTRYSSVRGIPLFGWTPIGSNSTYSRKTRPSLKSSPWSSRNRPTTRPTAARSAAEGMKHASAHSCGQHGDGEVVAADLEDAADQDDPGDGVGLAHQRGVQGVATLVIT